MDVVKEREPDIAIRAVIFDLDGTLLDTLLDLAEATNWALRQGGYAEHSVEEIRMMVGNGVGKLIERALPTDAGSQACEQTLSLFKSYYINHCEVHTRLYDGIEDLLRQLRAAGMKLAIVSNKLQAGVMELHRHYFDGLIDVAVGEREGVRRKPAPDMVEAAMHELGVQAGECVYVGDSDVDILTARNCSLPCISVLWGFRDRDFLLASGATMLAATPQEIPSLLRTIG